VPPLYGPASPDRVPPRGSELFDAPGLDAPPPVGAHGGEHPPIVSHEQKCAVVRLQRLLELLDRSQIEVVRRLVEHQQVGSAGLQQGEPGARALARGQLVDGVAHVVGSEAELREQRAHLVGRHLGDEGFECGGERLPPHEQ
jgi:hypothetical protein